MDPQVQASFIPKKPLDTGARVSHAGLGLFFLLALLLFIASLVAGGAEFLYTQYLQQSLASKTSSLNAAQGAYDPSVISDLERLDLRINQARQLLSNHVAASAIFSYLSTQTLQNVSFSSFTYELQSDGSADITLNGAADSFSTVALQSDQFGASQVLKDVVFSGITVGPSGTITFNVAATVIPSFLLYSSTLGGSSAAIQIASSTPSTGSGQATTTTSQ